MIISGLPQSLRTSLSLSRRRATHLDLGLGCHPEISSSRFSPRREEEMPWRDCRAEMETEWRETSASHHLRLRPGERTSYSFTTLLPFSSTRAFRSHILRGFFHGCDATQNFYFTNKDNYINFQLPDKTLLNLRETVTTL